ncbi:MAG: alpha/beta hydrolase [Spirochaetales bacterium]|nr:alpha/beta hydrolase [Spirochaetales bacterium]
MTEKIDGMNIYYEIKGEGRPILFLHGYAVDHLCLSASLEPAFADRPGYKRIYLDLPGMGRSDSSDRILCADQMIAVVGELLQRIIPGENYLLSGYSYGGYLAQGMVNKYAKEIDGLFLLCPVVIPRNTARNLPPLVNLERDRDFLARLTPKEAEEFGEMAVLLNEEVYQKCQKEILQPLAQGDKTFLRRYHREGYSFSFVEDHLPLPPESPFEKPSLIVTGRQDGVTGYEDFWPLLEHYPRATFAVLDRAGHNLQIENNSLLLSHLKEWLDRIEKN